MGSNDYIKWLEFVLGYSNEKKIYRQNILFDFKIFDSPQEMYAKLAEVESKKQNSARLVAGYCWNWSNPNKDGSLVNDVQIGSFAMPWEAKEGKHVQKGIPPWYRWAYHPGGFKQIGCIYTAQGFEFDYIGVIIGEDLVYNKDQDKLKGNIRATFDPKLKENPSNFDTYAKNIYRTLLTRGIKGCYVYFINKDTESFFKSQME